MKDPDAWRNGYDAWKLRGPDDDYDEDDEEARLDAEAQYEHMMEAQAEEEQWEQGGDFDA